MEKLQGYKITEKLDETRHSVVYRGKRDGDNNSYAIKVLKTEFPSPAEIARFYQEYEIIKNIDFEGVIKTYDIIDHSGGVALILEDFNGISLKQLLKDGPLPVKAFLTIACNLAEILGHLHKQNIIHKDIKPHNILINKKNGQVKLTDFGIAAELTGENREIYRPEVIEGTLSYMSPEQTGRMNRSIDYRTDFYSLGVTFYELLTGLLPFESDNPLEIIHAHIAKNPMLPSDIVKDIPLVLSNIIIKLLAKTAEDRYQNGFGLMADLHKCFKLIESKEKIEVFELGERDISIKLNIPQKLVGREKEIDLLLKTFLRASQGSLEMVMVSGYSGIGKSALINEIHKPIAVKNGYFISGKYEKFSRNVPYSSFIQAFKGLITQILTESKIRISYWRENILKALGPNGQVIADIVPEVELIIGKQPDIPLLEPEETKNRFFLACRQFVKAFAKKDHPLVIFMDDMQWVDSGSLSILTRLVKDTEVEYLFIIGAFRDNEVDESHILALAQEEVIKSGVKIEHITLPPLNINQTNTFISEFLKCPLSRSYELAELIVRKTHGNPFFVKQFLSTIYKEQLLIIEPETGWSWDLENIDLMQVTDNVVDLMARQITGLQENTRDALIASACIGSQFTLEALSFILEKPVKETLEYLSDAIDEGFIIQSKNIYLFQHDRIQEAAYSLIPIEKRNEVHHKIGRYGLDSIQKTELEENIFYIVDQLNFGKNLLSKPEDQEELAHLNLMAGKRAKNSSAYASAVNYLRIGRSLLQEQSWGKDYVLTWVFSLELAECEYLTGNLKNAEEIFDDVLKNATTNLDKAKVYNLMIMLNTTAGNLDEAVSLGLKGLKLFNIKLSKKTGSFRIIMELLKVAWFHRKIKIEDIADLPPMTDPEMIEVVTLFSNTGTPAYYVNTKLFAAMITMAIKFFLKYGLPDFASFGLIPFGLIIGSRFGKYENGYRYGKIGLKLIDKSNSKPFLAKSYFTFAYFIHSWQKPARDCIPYFSHAYLCGLESGDLIFTGHTINSMTAYRMFIGDHLDDIFRDHKHYMNFLKEQKDPFIINNYMDTFQLFLSLKNPEDEITGAEIDDHGQEKRLAEILEANNTLGLALHLIKKLISHFIMGRHTACVDIIDELDPIISITVGTLYTVEYHFYSALTFAALCPEKGDRKRKRYIKSIRKSLKKMKHWVDNCPENFLHKYLLIDAELARISGDSGKAINRYHSAIISAKENGFTQNEAIASERAAKYHLSMGYDEIARVYMTDARNKYDRWGASAKATALEHDFTHLVAASTRPGPSGSSSGLTGTSSIIDLKTLRNALKTIAEEKIFSKMIEKTIQTAIEFAGAQKGFLMLRKDTDQTQEANLLIEAEWSVDTGSFSILQSTPIEESTNLSHTVVNYVKRTGKSVVIENASEPQNILPQLQSETYILNNKIKSILCMPITADSDAGIEMIGLLYFENNRATDTFTEERIETLEIISLSAAGRLELSKKAITDGLTGLFNHDYFQNMLQQEILFTLRQGHDLSLIMIDIDRFKLFNDKWGHQVGDLVLKTVSETIRNSCRSSDIVARYGGEEIAILLRETGPETARDLAEKIRMTIKNLEVQHPDKRHHLLKVTISAGVAGFPAHARSKNSLIKKADDALYLSKKNGRDQVSLAASIKRRKKVVAR